MESPGKLVRERSWRQGLPKDLSLRKIDSVFPDNGAKMLSHNLYFDRRKGKKERKLV